MEEGCRAARKRTMGDDKEDEGGEEDEQGEEEEGG